MPDKTKTYERVIFTPVVIKEAEGTLVGNLEDENRKQNFQRFNIKLSTKEEWEHDNEEEFFADYVKGFEYAYFNKRYNGGGIEFSVSGSATRTTVSLPTRVGLESVFNVLESNVNKCRLPEPPPKKRSKTKIKVFIGHGHDTQWRDLKDHLHDKQGFDVEHYEHGTRAGLTIKEVLDEMLTGSLFAVLVLTGEDQDAEGKLHARENVIHELGLFQGRLGWRKAVALLEEGVEEFSNIHGINQIPFKKGNIQETFGEVLATIRREFSGN